MKSINSIKGLKFQVTLPDTHRDKILSLEQPNNFAIKACLKKDKVLILTHDATFRKPLAPLILAQGDNFIFPPQKFPELSTTAIMASPSKKVHDFLVKELNLNLKEDEATLIVGIDKEEM